MWDVSLNGPGSRHTSPSPGDKEHCEGPLDAVLSPKSHWHVQPPDPCSTASHVSGALQPGTKCTRLPRHTGELQQPLASLTLSQASRDFTSCAFWQDRMDPASVSMTPSTDSSVKKVICSGEERGCQPGRAVEQGADARGCVSRATWGCSAPSCCPIHPDPSPLEGCSRPTPTTRVSGRFQETMPTSPDSASCRHTSLGVRMGRGLCQAVGPRAVPALGQSPPSLSGLELAQEQQGRRGSPSAASWEKLLIQGTGEPGDCRQLCAGQRTQARIHAAGSLQGTQGLPGSCPHPTYAAWHGSRAGLPGPPPCCHCSTPRISPCLRLHKPAQGLSRSVSPQHIPWIVPRTAPGVPIPHRVTLG